MSAYGKLWTLKSELEEELYSRNRSRILDDLEPIVELAERERLNVIAARDRLRELIAKWRKRAYKSNQSTMSGIRQREIFNWCADELERTLTLLEDD